MAQFVQPITPASPVRASRTFVTVQQLAELQPALGIGAIRWDLFHRKTNGLEETGAIVRRGRRVLIDMDAYLSWLAAGRKGASDE